MMNIWLLLIGLLNVLLLAGLSFSLFLRLKEKKEDQRLTKGLQLLQNKISILQDLSDQTDEQIKNLVRLLDQKTENLKSEMHTADTKIHTLQIRSQQLIEQHQQSQAQTAEATLNTRNNSPNDKMTFYVQAARLAHSGFSADEIVSQIPSLNPAEIEMIVKVNKGRLQFSEEHLPQWVKQNTTSNLNIVEDELGQFAENIKSQNHNRDTEVSNPQAAAQVGSQIKPFQFKKI